MKQKSTFFNQMIIERKLKEYKKKTGKSLHGVSFLGVVAQHIMMFLVRF
jgi:hypothetical protein